MTFETALGLIKKGNKVQRVGWNGKGMWVALAEDVSTVKSVPVVIAVGDLPVLEVLPFLIMKTTDDKLVPWTVSQTDILADDWQVVE